MKPSFLRVLFVSALLFSQSCVHAPATTGNAFRSGFEHFITRSGDKLMEGEKEYRFISVNQVEPFIIFTNYNWLAGNDTSQPSDYDLVGNGMRLPNDYELESMVKSVREMGGQTFRAWLLPSRKATELGSSYLNHVIIDTAKNTVEFVEKSFERIDRLLQLCHTYGIRLEFVMGDNWDRLWGWPGDYGKDFFTVGSQGNQNYKIMVAKLLNRTNTYTGIKYKNDPAIFGWEPLNEPWTGSGVNDAWMADIAAYIKSIDPNHLFIDGRVNPDDFYPDYTLFDDHNIDVVQSNYYSMITGNMASDTRLLRDFTRGKKPYIVGEIPPYSSVADVQELLETVHNNGVTAAMMWTAKYPNRDGGWYYQEKSSLHWPGFPDLATFHPDYQTELDLLNVISGYAYQIQGLTRPLLSIPEPPTLLPIKDVGHISWQTSINSQSYEVQRSKQLIGPWHSLGEAYDVLVSYNSLFADETAEIGKRYYYRIVAKNGSGSSHPSNVVGPVAASESWFVDNLNDMSKIHDQSNTQIDFSYKEPNNKTAHAMCGYDPGMLERISSSDGFVVFAPQSAGKFNSVKIYAYFDPDAENSDLSFYGSENGVSYSEITLSAERTKWTRMKIFEKNFADNNYRYFKIILTDSTHSLSPIINRVEIAFDRGEKHR